MSVPTESDQTAHFSFGPCCWVLVLVRWLIVCYPEGESNILTPPKDKFFCNFTSFSRGCRNRAGSHNPGNSEFNSHPRNQDLELVRERVSHWADVVPTLDGAVVNVTVTSPKNRCPCGV